MRPWRTLLGTVGALAVLAGGAAWAEPALWRVRDHDTTITLFGSMHALPQGARWRTAALDQAMAEADEVWFEFPSPRAPGVAEEYARAYRELPPPAFKVSERLSPAARVKAVQVFGSLAAMDAQRPSALIQELSRRYWARLGAEVRFGVEAYVQDAVPPERHRSFGKPAQHLALNARAPMEEQIRDLDNYLRSSDDVEPLRRSMQAWLDGDVAALDREAVARLRTRAPGSFERIVSERNRAWADEIVRMLDRPGEMLVVVGAGHMSGPEGLPALLRARGIRVEGP